MLRNPTLDELGVVERLLDTDVAGAAQLRYQLADCLVRPMNDDETILRFFVPAEAPVAQLPYAQNVAVEARAKDIDGCTVEVILHVKDGKLHELEFVKTDGTMLQSKPLGMDLSDFAFFF